MNNEMTDGAADSSLPTPCAALPAPGSAPAPGESERAFEAFRVYLELGPQRRYFVVARKVGVGLRTVKRWAIDFDWRGRVKTHIAQTAGQNAETEAAMHREELLDAAARTRAFRDRQFAVAEAILDAAERYLEHVDGDDLDLMSFADACRALEIASRIGQQAADTDADDTVTPAQKLHDQLSSLLDQAYAEMPAKNNPLAGTPAL